ncbi:hypothetical protein [Alkalimonas sp.]|uniref:hypothetical protein n=1 Tax=Alkalimonas sp. TaxID=1872453 RepID=UPI00263B9747|nr:hypothetical protein [Alkalimonas sp.]MCC5827482.1 hypothetical protein [Alkalimonas sp.]
MKACIRLIVALLLCVLLSHCSQLPTPPTPELLPHTAAAVQQFNQGFRVQLTLNSKEVQLAPWALQFDAVSLHDQDLLPYLRMLKQELGKYPTELLELSGLQQILLVRNLSVAGQPRLAVPDYVHEVLIYDIGHHDMAFNRHVLHHEFYHMLEEELYGSAYYRDPLWLPLKPDDFRYGKGGAFARASEDAAFSHPMQGFINRYAMSGLEEDKAELWTILWADASWRQVKPLLQQDQLLREKLQLLVYQIGCLAPEIRPRLAHRLNSLDVPLIACAQSQ